MKILVVTSDQMDDLVHYGKLVADILVKDEEFQALIRKYGPEQYEAAIDLQLQIVMVLFLDNKLPHVAAGIIKASFMKASEAFENQQHAFYADLLANMPMDKTH